MIHTGERYSEDFNERLKEEREQWRQEEEQAFLDEQYQEQYRDHQDYLLSKMYLFENEVELDDRESKNRNNLYYKKGGKHPNAIITEANVVTIIDMQSKGLKPKDIAKEIGVNVRIIYDVISGRTWGHFTKNLNQQKQ